MRNALVKGMNDQMRIPKWIVIVPEADIISDFDLPKKNLCVADLFAQTIEWIMKEMKLIIEESLKKGMPQSSTEIDRKFPNFLWITPVDHCNLNTKNRELREKFSKTLVEVAKLHNELIVLPLKQLWMKDNIELFSKMDQKMTQKGANLFWMSIDRTVKYADSILKKNPERPLHDLFYQQKRTLFSYHDYFQPSKRGQFEHQKQPTGRYGLIHPSNQQHSGNNRENVRKRLDFS